MDLGRPHSLISSGADLDVLAVLSRTTAPLSGREIARRADRSQEWTRRVVRRLAEQGVVDGQSGGGALLYELNRRHLAAPAIEQLVGLRVLLLDRLREEIGGWEVAPESAALFGSAARGDGNLQSDIDLLIVRPAPIDEENVTWRGQLDTLAEGIRAWTGNHASIVELGAGEIDGLLDRSPPVLDGIRHDAIDLGGLRIRTLLRRAR